MKKILSLVFALLLLLPFTYITISAEGNVFTVGGASFSSLDDAITVAKRSLIKMTGDGVLNSRVKDYYSSGIHLDGGGHTLRLEGSISINAGSTAEFSDVVLDLGGKYYIRVGAGGKVILGDGALIINGGGSYGGAVSLGGDGATLIMRGTSKITGSTAKTASAVAVGRGATLKLEGGLITGNTALEEGGGAVRAIAGSVVALSGTASITGNSAPDGESNLVITDTGILKLYENFKGSVRVSLTSGNEKTKTFGQFAGDMGGSRLYSDQDKTLTAVIAEDGSLVWGETAKSTGTVGASSSASASQQNKAENTEKLYNQSTDLSESDKKQAESGNKFKVGNTFHSDLATAVSSSGGKEITLIGDAEWNGAVKDFYSSKIDINGNGFTLKLPSTILINSGSTLTLKNVTVDLSGYCFKIAGSGKIVLDEGATLKNGGNDFGGAISAEGATSTVTMKPGSKITGARGKVGAGIGTLSGATVELLGGTIENGTTDDKGAVFITSGAKVTLSGDFTLKNNKSGGAEGGIEISDEGALTVKGEFTGSAGIKVPNASSGASVGKETGGAVGTEKIYVIGKKLVVVTDGKGGLKLGSSGQSTVSDASKVEAEDDKKNENSAYYDKTGWTATANSVAPGREAPKAIDGSYTTVWHTEYGWENNQVTWKTPLPHNLDVDFPEPIAVAGFTLVTNPGAPAGQPTDMEFYVKIDGEYKLVKEYKYNVTSESYSQTLVNEFNAAVMAEGVRLLYLDALDGHGTLAELEIIKPTEGMKAEPFDDFLATMGKNMYYPIDMEKSSVTYDGENWGRSTTDNIMDGEITTYWQANTNMKAPYNLVVDFGDIYTVNGFSYTTRQTVWYDGYWDSYNIYTSDDGEKFKLLYEKQSFLPRNLARQEFIFDEEVTTRFVKFEILAGTGNLCSVAEIEFLEDFDSYMERRKANEEYYTLKVGSRSIAHINGTTELDTAPYIENGTTFIPLRGLLELMGVEVAWDGEVNAVDIKKGTTEIYLQIRNKNVYVTTLKFGKERYTLLSAPRITDGRTFIPLRFVSEMLGYDVSWNAEAQEISITK